jgi:hypothetical protein
MANVFEMISKHTDVDTMTATELGLVLNHVAIKSKQSTFFSQEFITKVMTKASMMLILDGASARHELYLAKPRLSQLEMDLSADWAEVDPDELSGDLDEHELHKLGYAIAVDHKTRM